MLQSLNEGLLKIKKELTKCKAINSSKKYIFKRSIPLIHIIDKIKTDKNKNYIINKFVLNYNNKIIALLITNVLSKEHIYIPCMPTGIKNYIENQEYTTIDDDSIWNTYETTIEELEEIQRNIDILYSITEEKPITMSYPSNSYNETTIKILKNKGIKFAFRADNLIEHSPYELPRIDARILLDSLG